MSVWTGAIVGGACVLVARVGYMSYRVLRSSPARFGFVPPRLWGWIPWLGSAIGTIKAAIPVVWRCVAFLALPAAIVVAATSKHHTAALVLAGSGFAAFVVATLMSAWRRVVVGDFENDVEDAAGVDLADLLRGEIARLADLLHVVGDRRAVSSGLAEQSALDATLSVDELSALFKGPITGEAKVSFAGVTLPLAPVAQLIGKLFATPRIVGRLHRDGDQYILTAQTTRGRRVSWRVDAPAGAPPTDEDRADSNQQAVLAEMVRELSLRMYTDLALDQTVRWEACEHFVDGLRAFRTCIRTPKDRKVNLRRAEAAFLDALAVDEDFPLAYYNLGVVYTELLGLARVAGRTKEEKIRLSAAATSFGRAIEKAPARWDCHFAFAQTQLKYERFEEVEELCYHLLRTPKLTTHQRALSRELLARALRARRGKTRQALRESRRAAGLAFAHLFVARVKRQTQRTDEDARAVHAARVVSGCLLTYGGCYLDDKLAGSVKNGDAGWWVRRRLRQVEGMLTRLGELAPEFGHECGQAARKAKAFKLAKSQLEAAKRSMPTRPDYAADLALCLAHEAESPISAAERKRILEPTLDAAHSLVGGFFPAHDAAACRSVADVYERLAELEIDRGRAHVEGDTALAALFRAVATELEATDGKGSRSGLVLRELERRREALQLDDVIGAYGIAARQAWTELDVGKGVKDNQKGDDDRKAMLEHFKAALTAANEATSLNPLSTFAWETLGDIYAEFHDYVNARDAWNRALLTDPDNPHLYNKIGSSHWNLAFGGGARVATEDLEVAAENFRLALLLFTEDDLDKQILTHERLGKLSASIGDLDQARAHLLIAHATGSRPPIAGWVTFALALLRCGHFSECEYHFARVVEHGERLTKPDENGHVHHHHHLPVGDRLDEAHWPLAVVRAWGHVGLALSWIERQASAKRIDEQLTAAQDLLDTLYGDADPITHKRYPTRIPAAIREARARLLLLHDESRLDDAIPMLEDAISQFPYSRTHLALADALERKARRAPDEAQVLRRRAEALIDHAVALQPSDELTAAANRLRGRLSKLAGTT